MEALGLGFPSYLYPLSAESASGLSYFSHVSDRAVGQLGFDCSRPFVVGSFCFVALEC